MTRATTSSSASPILTSSAPESEAEDDEELLDDPDEPAFSTATWRAVSCDDGMPSKTGSVIALLKAKNSSCMFDTSF